MKSFVLLASLLLLASAEPWDRFNKPEIFQKPGQIFNPTFGAFKEKAELKVIPWTDDYWPSYQSGIAHRYLSSNPQDFRYNLLNESAVRSANWTTLSRLSPAEKLDIFNGRFDYPTVRSEWLRTRPDAPDWEGLCHGWAPAAGLYAEPGNVTVASPVNGIQIPFGSGDVKALLTYFNAEYARPDSWFISNRCNYNLRRNPSYEKASECADMHPATFHIILTNQISSGEFFVADVDRGEAVWNQPIFKYAFTLNGTRNPSNSSAPGTYSEILINTVMTYARESESRWTPHTHDPVVFSKEYKYWLEIDINKKIIGGSWISWERPDFSWKNEMVAFSGYFKNLSIIYNASIGVKVSALEESREISMIVEENHEEKNVQSGKVAVLDYSADHQQSWSLFSQNSKTISIEFKRLNTERNRDKVKIYEGKNGEGALLAVIHGDVLPPLLHFNSNAVLVQFVADRTGSGEGFDLEYNFSQ